MGVLSIVTTAEEPERRHPTEAERVFTFGVQQFERLGFTPPQAERLVGEGADYHDAEALLKRGCPVDIAFDLLSD